MSEDIFLSLLLIWDQLEPYIFPTVMDTMSLAENQFNIANYII